MADFGLPNRETRGIRSAYDRQAMAKKRPRSTRKIPPVVALPQARLPGTEDEDQDASNNSLPSHDCGVSGTVRRFQHRRQLADRNTRFPIIEPMPLPKIELFNFQCLTHAISPTADGFCTCKLCGDDDAIMIAVKLSSGKIGKTPGER